MKKSFDKTQTDLWVSDQRDGNYINPVLHSDYSDLDVIRVGEDFYMTASSFSHIPGLPILHSKDLVNWQLIGHALAEMPLPGYEVPQHGKGVYAPSIRYHNEKFWIYYGDPDIGIFMTTSDDPTGEWSPIHLVYEGKGLIDPCPLWDDDGQAYLVHAFAYSRCGVKDKLRVHRMAPDGRRLLDEGHIVFDSPDRHPTLEGPKFYKRNGYYYIFAPAGGVSHGWQTILRAKEPAGPYEDRIVLHQGSTSINGPHQGGWVELESGESWFVHFQYKEPYGRVVHLQPVCWEDEWPLMGNTRNGDIGEPVSTYRKPDVGRSYAVVTPAASDEFEVEKLGLQWQWQANPSNRWYSLRKRQGYLRLYSTVPVKKKTIYDVPNLLLQKFPAPSFQAYTRFEYSKMCQGDEAGLVVFGYRHARLTVNSKMNTGEFMLMYTIGDQEHEEVKWSTTLSSNDIIMRVTVNKDATCLFSYSTDGIKYERIPVSPFVASIGRWVGAKLGVFSMASDCESKGYADYEWFRFEKYI